MIDFLIFICLWYFFFDIFHNFLNICSMSFDIIWCARSIQTVLVNWLIHTISFYSLRCLGFSLFISFRIKLFSVLESFWYGLLILVVNALIYFLNLLQISFISFKFLFNQSLFSFFWLMYFFLQLLNFLFPFSFELLFHHLYTFPFLFLLFLFLNQILNLL